MGAIKRLTPNDNAALRRWDVYKKNMYAATPIDHSMSAADIEKHRKYLEAHPLEWIRFFLPKHAKSEFAEFHKKAIRRILAKDEWFEVLSWARSLSKSTVTMFVVMLLVLSGRKRSVILASATQESAIKLLKPYKAELENNERIKQYYGNQFNPGSWKEGAILLKNGVSMVAVGYGNAPRGARNEEVRPDTLLVDDFDTDEACRNPDTLDKMWQWWEHALYPTRDLSTPTLVVFCGNIIAKDCCIVRAGAMADHWDIVNVRDKDGKSTWPEKNSEESIDRSLSKLSASAQQAEYFNNPVSVGEIFGEITYGKVPPLSKFKFLVAYGDPAPGENKSKQSSTKTCILLGKLAGKLYVIKPFLDRGLNSEFIEWYIALNDYVAGKTTVYNYIENNKLQDPFFQQVFKPIVAGFRKRLGHDFYIRGDEEKKTDKATRIEANLEPLNSHGNLVFNIDEKDNPHMKRLEDQFKLFTLRLRYPADGPDCVEGGNRIIDRKLQSCDSPAGISTTVLRTKNKHRL